MSKLVSFKFSLGVPDFKAFRWPWQHRCKMEMVGAEAREAPDDPGSRFFGSGGPFTLVLTRCKCGDVAEHRMSGRWTLAQLRGTEASESVDALLKEIG